MKRSRYTSLVTDFPQPGQHLAFNWLTQAMAVVDEDLRGVLGAGAPCNAAQVPPEYAQQLAATGLVVADQVDERQEIEDWYRRARGDTSTFKVMVLTTYDCNFACTYCVEEGVKRPVALGGDLPERIVAWIERRLERHESQRLYLNFYGGEPLLNMDGLERVAAPLSAYARDHGIGFGGNVTTNGALLNRSNAERLTRVGVTQAKVTLDGDRVLERRQREIEAFGLLGQPPVLEALRVQSVAHGHDAVLVPDLEHAEGRDGAGEEQQRHEAAQAPAEGGLTEASRAHGRTPAEGRVGRSAALRRALRERGLRATSSGEALMACRVTTRQLGRQPDGGGS